MNFFTHVIVKWTEGDWAPSSIRKNQVINSSDEVRVGHSISIDWGGEVHEGKVMELAFNALQAKAMEEEHGRKYDEMKQIEEGTTSSNFLEADMVEARANIHLKTTTATDSQGHHPRRPTT